MKLFVIIALLFFSSINKQTEISGAFDLIDIDALGNIIVTEDNVVKKYDNNFVLVYSYSNPQLGKPSAIQTNSLQNIMVFYEDFSKILFLDNKLSEKADAIQMSDFEMFDIQSICFSYDNGFWVFDQSAQNLVRYNRILKQTNLAENIDLNTGERLDISKMLESRDYLVLFDKKNGLFVFDKFATFLFAFEKNNIIDFDIIDSKIYYLIEDSMFVYDAKLHSNSNLNLNLDSVKSFSLNQNKLVTLKDDKIEIYKH